MHRDMKEKVSQFMAEPLEIVAIEGVHRFVRFFNQVIADGPVRLAPVPGALPAKPADDGDEPDEISSWNGGESSGHGALRECLE
jgi:hypothetical protein